MKNLKKLTLLHSNDLHGDFLAERIDNKLVGGVSMLSGYINKVRAEEENVIYCIAGDMFRGSVIDAEYKGVSTIEIMNLLGPDVVTIGNHEVDYGLSHLLFIEKCANFPIINANFHIRTNNKRLFQPFYIAHIDGMKILFIGIITEDVLAQTKMDKVIGSFVDICEAAEEIGRICNTYNPIDIDFTIILTHIGFEEDKKLAAILDPAWGVDVIIGGHSHTFLEHPVKVNDILIVQAGTGTDQIGRFDIMVDTDLNAVDTYTWSTVPIDETHCPRDESLGIDVMLMGSGAIRSYNLGPVVLYSDFTECFPYDEAVYMLPVTGEQLTRMIKRFLREEAFTGEHTEFYQLSQGMHVVWSRSGQCFKELTFDGKPLGAQQIYKIGLCKYHYSSLKPFLDITLEEVEANGRVRVLATSYRDVIEEYFMTHQHLKRELEGRLIIED